MTKEQAAIWRREQRRKRNRESAAASRQRQRDRIGELEIEVEDWKKQYALVLEKIRLAENHAPEEPEDAADPPPLALFVTVDATTTRARSPDMLQGNNNTLIKCECGI